MSIRTLVKVVMGPQGLKVKKITKLLNNIKVTFDERTDPLKRILKTDPCSYLVKYSLDVISTDP